MRREVGELVEHKLSNSKDRIDAVAVQPDGTQIVRLEIRDRWFFARDTAPAA